jgi:hypothetical protein
VSKEDYRKNAMECMRLANEVSTPSAKIALLQMAQAWVRLYDQSVRNSETDVYYETPPRRENVPQQQEQQQQQQQQRSEPEQED